MENGKKEQVVDTIKYFLGEDSLFPEIRIYEKSFDMDFPNTGPWLSFDWTGECVSCMFVKHDDAEIVAIAKTIVEDCIRCKDE